MMPAPIDKSFKLHKNRHGGKGDLPAAERFHGIYQSVWVPNEQERQMMRDKAAVSLVVNTRVKGHPEVSMNVQLVELTDDSDKPLEHKPPRRTDIRAVQEILFAGARQAANHVTADTDGAFLLATAMSESLAAITVELVSKGTVLTEPGGPDKIVKATLAPLEQFLRENIADYLKGLRKGG